MSKKLDVLEVMDTDGRGVSLWAEAAPAKVGVEWMSHLDKHDEARMAVAELISAARFAIGVDRVTDGLRDAIARCGY